MVLSKRARDIHRCLRNIDSFSNRQASVIDWDSDTLRWIKICVAPVDGPYKGGRFDFEVQFEKHYPKTSPSVACLTPIYHPNIDIDCDEYNVCLSLLDEWQESFGLEDLIQGLLFLLYNPNLEDPLSPLFDGCIEWEEYISNVRKSLMGGNIEGKVFLKMIEGDPEKDVPSGLPAIDAGQVETADSDRDVHDGEATAMSNDNTDNSVHEASETSDNALTESSEANDKKEEMVYEIKATCENSVDSSNEGNDAALRNNWEKMDTIVQGLVDNVVDAALQEEREEMQDTDKSDAHRMLDYALLFRTMLESKIDAELAKHNQDDQHSTNSEEISVEKQNFVHYSSLQSPSINNLQTNDIQLSKDDDLRLTADYKLDTQNEGIDSGDEVVYYVVENPNDVEDDCECDADGNMQKEKEREAAECVDLGAVGGFDCQNILVITSEELKEITQRLEDIVKKSSQAKVEGEISDPVGSANFEPAPADTLVEALDAAEAARVSVEKIQQILSEVVPRAGVNHSSSRELIAAATRVSHAAQAFLPADADLAEVSSGQSQLPASSANERDLADLTSISADNTASDGESSAGETSEVMELKTPLAIPDILEKVEAILKDIEENGEPPDLLPGEEESDTEEEEFDDTDGEFDSEETEFEDTESDGELLSEIEQGIEREKMFKMGYVCLTFPMAMLSVLVDLSSMFKL